MIKSVGGNYMDMVCMSPIAKMDSDVLNAIWKNVLEKLTEIGYDVVVDTLDGHSSNRKFYTEKLCDGKLRICIPHPFKEGEWIYLIFDTVRIFKCICNNL